MNFTKSLFIILILAGLVVAQTTVNYNVALYNVGASFSTRTVDDAAFDPGPSGFGSWDFTSFTAGDESDFVSVEYDPAIPHIGDCAETPNYILYYFGTTDTSEIEGWGFFKVDPGYVDALGLYGTMSSIPPGTNYFFYSFNTSYTHSHQWPAVN